MRKAIALILLLSLLFALGGCAGNEQTAPSELPSVTDAPDAPPAAYYAGELPADVFGVFDEESYTNEAFGVSYLRDGSWSFYTMQELTALNGAAPGDGEKEILKSAGFVYDMYARSGLETLGFALAIPSVRFGRSMTEQEYAQAVKDASARDYAGADYDVVSDEIGTADFGGAQHACFYLTVAANGMVFHTEQIFLQHGDLIGVIYVSAENEEARNALLGRFRAS